MMEIAVAKLRLRAIRGVTDLRITISAADVADTGVPSAPVGWAVLGHVKTLATGQADLTVDFGPELPAAAVAVGNFQAGSAVKRDRLQTSVGACLRRDRHKLGAGEVLLSSSHFFGGARYWQTRCKQERK
jgi:hypothetical protein